MEQSVERYLTGRKPSDEDSVFMEYDEFWKTCLIYQKFWDLVQKQINDAMNQNVASFKIELDTKTDAKIVVIVHTEKSGISLNVKTTEVHVDLSDLTNMWAVWHFFEHPKISKPRSVTNLEWYKSQKTAAVKIFGIVMDNFISY